MESTTQKNLSEEEPKESTLNTPPNPEEASRSDPAYTRSRSSKFRFKSSNNKRRNHSPSYRSSSSRREKNGDSERSHHGRRHHHHRHHHRSSNKRRKTHDHSPPRRSPPDENDEPPLSPETAFRESLFDAMADDEGAAFWESVYGQPIHTYAVPPQQGGPEGELERMTEEEYAAYVRARMWERSHEGIMAERERQRQEKARRAKEKQNEDDAQWRRRQDRLHFDQAVEESLRRGEARRRAKSMKAAWEKYIASWEELNNAAAAESAVEPSTTNRFSNFHIRNNIHWPVESGKRRDISHDEIKRFVWNAPPSSSSSKESNDGDDLTSTLKVERVRWHPDKMLHRYGNLGLGQDKSLIQSVTEVFQILDQLWTETRGTS